MELIELTAERDKLQAHLNWLGVRSDGSEKIERRIAQIDEQIQRIKNKAI